jgi:hypothetical protein
MRTLVNSILTVLLLVTGLAGLTVDTGTAWAGVIDKKKPEKEADTKAAAEPAKGGEEEGEEPKKKNGDKAFEDVVEDFEVIKGFFTFYVDRDEGKTYLEIKPAQLDEIFLCSITREAGDGFFFDSGAMMNEFPFVFRRVGKKIQMVHKNVLFRANKSAAIHRAIGRGLSDSLVGAAKIEAAPHPDRGSLLVDPSSFFVQDVGQVGYIFKEFIKTAQYGMDKENSYFGEIKSFPANSEIDVALHFTTSSPKTHPTVPNAKSFYHTYHYSLSELPDTGFNPRLADDRIGHFLTMYQDYTSQLQDTPYVRYVNRWHLEKAEPKFAVSKPRQPIVFWLENTIPVEYRDAVREGVLIWNTAFEKIGFENAIEVKQQPDDADWDPSDVRYTTIRWIVQPGGGYAVGPSRTNPFTGQIYDADIRVSSDFLRFLYREWGEFIEPLAQDGSQSASIPESVGLMGRAMRGLCDHQEGAARQAAFASSILAVRSGTSGPVDMKQFIHDYLVEVIAHEVGHTLGLRHNFKASTILDVENLHDSSGGVHTASLMDYNPINIARKGQKQGAYMQTVLGPYDYWAIEYAYAQIDSSGPESEAAVLAKIASRAAEPELQYGTDEDAFGGPRGMDPTATRFDLGANSIEYYRGRVELAHELWADLEGNFEKSGERYQRLRQVFSQGLGEYGGAVANVTKYIGGMYHRRDHVGDPGGRLPFEPVPAARQRQALGLLQDRVFGADAFDFPSTVLNKLASERFWDFTGSIFEQERNDYPIHAAIRSIQVRPLDHIFSPVLMSRMLDIELRDQGDYLTLAEVFESLRSSIWSEAEAGSSVSSIRRSLQREHLDRLTKLVVNPAPGVPDDASALARMDLQELREALESSGSADNLDAYSRAHFDESLARIEAALEAGIQRQLGV